MVFFFSKKGLLFFTIILATLLRFYQIGKLSFEGDELSTLWFVTRSFKSMFQVVSQNAPDMSLYYLIVHYWVKILPGSSEGILRALPAIFSVASIPVVFLLGRNMSTNRKQAIAIGLVASFLVTLNAFHIQYAQELRSYSLVFLLATLSTLLLIKAIEEPDSINDWWIWYVLVSVAAVYSHFFAVFVLITQIVSLLVLLRGNIRTFPLKVIAGSIFAIVVLIAPVAIASYAYMGGQAEKFAYIPKPTFSGLRTVTIELSGNSGVSLLALYLFTGSIGLLAGAKTWLSKNLIAKWKFTLIASCLFLPVIMVLGISEVIMPFFLSRYLLLVLPYLAVLAAIGIVTLTTMGWKNRKLRLMTVPIGIAILTLFVVLSGIGIKAYFEKFQKEDFRGTAQFLTKECSEDLRLYHIFYLQEKITYYSAELTSQVPQREWRDKLGENLSLEELLTFLPDEYHRVCLVLWSNITPERRVQTKTIQAALRIKFPKVSQVKFYKVLVEIYEL